MKKYVKPELFYEDFELSQHIAGCNLTMGQNDPLDCTASGTVSDGYDSFFSEAWFVGGNSVCTFPAESFCYTNAAYSVTTINS